VTSDPRPLPPDIDRHLAAAREYCLRLSRDKHLAEDAVHDAYLIAVRRGHTVRDPAHWRGWFCRVARRRLLDLLRARSRRSGVPLTEEIAAPTPDEVEESCRRTRRILRAIKNLPEPVRAAVRQRYLEGEPLKRIAARLNTSVDSVKSRLYRARRILRRETRR